MILLVGLACTIWGKWMILRQLRPPTMVVELTRVALSDVLFFAVVLLVIRSLHVLKPSRWTARCALLIAAAVLVWSIANATWLTESGVQLQPGILKLFVRDAAELWPLVKVHLVARPVLARSLVFGVFLGLAVFAWSLLRPREVVPVRIHHARWAGAIALGIAILLLTRYLVSSQTGASSHAATLGFSSHQYALASTLGGAFENDHRAAQTRRIPRVGERRVTPPEMTSKPFPNVVLVILESIPRSVTSLADKDLGTTPCLARLAREGADFRQMRIVVTHTTKALWAILTGANPIIGDDYVEAVLADQPYESLPSLLARVGYRSAYFQVAKGSFECAPGLASNLGFDWAWFRENLADPSAHLGYLAGDDCRMIEPAFQWATETSRPFFLMMVTSASHDPYEIPKWFGKVRERAKDRYLDTIRYTDHFLEQVCKAMKDRGLDGNTILCVLGDHGVSFRPGASKAGGRWWPHEEVIHVPWTIWWPARIEAGRSVDGPCSHLDVTPTILRLIGFDIAEARFEGQDAFRLPKTDRRLYFSSWYANSPVGFVQGSRKVVYLPYLNKALEYDLKTDPDEMHPTEASAKEVEGIKRELLDWQKKTHVHFEPKRFRERLLFLHWQTFCAGRSAWAYYVP